jgi:aminomethyltransferase
MCLYGLDLDETTSPVEAGLAWVIPKSRRQPGNDSYIGAEIVQRQLVDGPTRRRVGLITEVPARSKS